MNSDALHVERSSRSEDISPAEKPEAFLPIVEPHFVEDDIPRPLADFLTTLLQPKDSIFALFRLNSFHTFESADQKNEKAPLWTMLTGNRLWLLAVSNEGQAYTDSFDQHTLVEYQTGFGRDAIKIADQSLSSKLWEGKGWLFKEAVNLFPLPEYEKYLYLARLALEKQQKRKAVLCLQKSLEYVPTINAYLLLAHIFTQENQQNEAFNVLHEAFKLAPFSSLFDEMQRLFPDHAELFVYLAVICEERHDWEGGIAVYHALLRKTPDFDLYFLKLGEMYNANQDYQSAFEYYQKFIEFRQESEKFKKGEFIHWDMAEFHWFSSDPDLVKAYFDLGLLYEYEFNDLEQAASMYLTLLHLAPFYIDAYKHFWSVYQQLHANSASSSCSLLVHIPTLLQIYHLLAPENYHAIVEGGQYPFFPDEFGASFLRLPIAYHKMEQANHELLIHPGEQESWHQVQQWIANLVISEDESDGIEEYCEQVGPLNYPELAQTITQIAAFLDVSSPKCFISRGKIGMSVRNREDPFIFIGSEHLNSGNDRYFLKEELVFSVAGQTEHIKSGHLLVTDTEVWKSLGTASFDSFLAALQCLPVGGFLGKITHQFATAGLKKVYKMTRHGSMQKVLDLFYKKKEDAFRKEEAGTIEDAEKNERTQMKQQPEPESVIKEQIVDFTRHAVYTADRIGLIACNNFAAACSAIFKVSGTAYEDLRFLQAEGLFHILQKQDPRGNFLYFEYAKRFSELVKFAISEEYARVHGQLLMLPEEFADSKVSATKELRSAQHLLLDKLHILEHSMRNNVLTSEEFFRKQKNLIRHAEFLSDDDFTLIDKLQQAFLDNILTIEELHHKLFHLLESSYQHAQE